MVKAPCIGRRTRVSQKPYSCCTITEPRSTFKIEGVIPLHLAARHGHMDAMMALLEQGANTNNVDGSRNTALHPAGLSGHGEIVKKLLEHEADANANK